MSRLDNAARPIGEQAGVPTGSRESLWTRDFVLACLVYLLVVSGLQTALPNWPLYVSSLGGQESAMGIVVAIFTGAALLTRPWVGRHIDRGGRRGIYLVGLAVSVLIFLSYGLAPSILWLVVLRLFHGLSWGVMTTTGGTVIADLIPPARRGEGMGYYGMINTLGTALAPTIGIVLANSFGFGSVFMVGAGLGLVAVVLASAIRYRPVVPGPRDGKSAFFERQAFTPAAISLCTSVAFAGIIAFLPIHARQFGITNIGPFYTAQALSLVVVRPVSGKLHDQHGPAIVIVPGLLVVGGAMVAVSAATSLAAFLVAGVLMGVGMGAVQPALQAMSVDGVPPERRGAANSTFFSALDIGMGGGAFLLGWIAQATSYSTMYLAGAAAAAIGLAIFGVARPGVRMGTRRNS